jgi:hypothetical protein
MSALTQPSPPNPADGDFDRDPTGDTGSCDCSGNDADHFDTAHNGMSVGPP